jgi:hypothetical protein
MPILAFPCQFCVSPLTADVTDVPPRDSQEFITDFQNGKLEPHLKSEPVPEADDTGVTTVVGKNFDEVVTSSGKDVFIEFYAPWW